MFSQLTSVRHMWFQSFAKCRGLGGASEEPVKNEQHHMHRSCLIKALWNSEEYYVTWNIKGSFGNYSALRTPMIFPCWFLGWLSLTGSALKMPSNVFPAEKVFVGHENQLLGRHFLCRLPCCPWNEWGFIGLPSSHVFSFIWPFAFIALGSNCNSV